MKRNVLVRKVACHWNMFSRQDVEPLFGLDALQRFLSPQIFETPHPANHLLESKVQLWCYKADLIFAVMHPYLFITISIERKYHCVMGNRDPIENKTHRKLHDSARKPVPEHGEHSRSPEPHSGPRP